MEYNTSRDKLIIAEYGRNVQRLVNYAADIKDKEERNKVAKAIVTIMGQINQSSKNGQEFDQKLWDHMQIISDFKLDIESPYPKPSAETIEAKPAPLGYPKKQIKMRHYGKNLEVLIDKAVGEKDEEKKKFLTGIIANYMKTAYRNWNKESISNEVIKMDIEKFSDGKLTIDDDFNFSSAPSSYRRRPSQSRQGRSNNGNRRRHSNNKKRY